MAWLRLIRWPNLLIVMLTQWVLYDLLVGQFQRYDISPVLDYLHFGLFVLSTVIITAGGYIINDLKDYEIDLLNRPERLIINRLIPATRAQRVYLSLNILGFLLSLYLAIKVKNLPLVLLFPGAVALLWWYSHSLKRQILSGNLVVAFFCAFVAAIVYFAERAAFSAYWDQVMQENILWAVLCFYTAFAFFSTLLREIVKDIEDYEGDLDEGCQTLAIYLGMSKARRVAVSLTFVLLAIVIFWAYYQVFHLESYIGLSAVIFLMILPILYSLYQISLARHKQDYHQASRLTKWVMVSGIFYLLILQYIIL